MVNRSMCVFYSDARDLYIWWAVRWTEQNVSCVTDLLDSSPDTANGISTSGKVFPAWNGAKIVLHATDMTLVFLKKRYNGTIFKFDQNRGPNLTRSFVTVYVENIAVTIS